MWSLNSLFLFQKNNSAKQLQLHFPVSSRHSWVITTCCARCCTRVPILKHLRPVAAARFFANGVHISTNRYMIKSTLKIARCCSLINQGFSNFLGVFQVIMANHVRRCLDFWVSKHVTNSTKPWSARLVGHGKWQGRDQQTRKSP